MIEFFLCSYANSGTACVHFWVRVHKLTSLLVEVKCPSFIFGFTFSRLSDSLLKVTYKQV